MKKFTTAATAILIAVMALAVFPAAFAASANNAPLAVSFDPVSVESVSPESASLEPVSTEPVSFEPVSAEPVSFEPVSTEPVSLEPVSREPFEVSRPGSGTTAKTGDAGFAVFALLAAASGAAIVILRKRQST